MIFKSVDTQHTPPVTSQPALGFSPSRLSSEFSSPVYDKDDSIIMMMTAGTSMLLLYSLFMEFNLTLYIVSLTSL